MANKKKSKLRKFLKGAAMAGAAALGARALMGNKGMPAANVDSGRGGDSSSAAARLAANKIYQDDIMRGGSGVKFNRRNMYSPNDFGLGPYDGAKDGGRIGAKKGGRIGCGVAKRGFGRALKKGGKK
tara:strand:- start:22 stop:402 length:381 start_codon:yes stop_codon:yes gene_type:complete